jgi:hypothetical protein
VQQWTVAFDAPAYIRRAKAVEAAWEQLRARCLRQRAEWLQIPRLRLGMLFARIADPQALQPLLADPVQIQALVALHAEWQPELRLTSRRPITAWEAGLALRQLSASFARFNRRWSQFVDRADLKEVNRLRDGYNRYYVLEKECAVRSASVARAGFRPLPQVTPDDLLAEFPLLPDIRIA